LTDEDLANTQPPSGYGGAGVAGSAVNESGAEDLDEDNAGGTSQAVALTAATLPDVSASLTAGNESVLTTFIDSNTPVSTTPNVVYSTTGAGVPAAISGDLNAVVVTAPLLDSNVTIPGGYALEYITGGDATLNGPQFAFLVGSSTIDTMNVIGGDTAIGGNGFNIFNESDNQDSPDYIYGGTGQDLIKVSGDAIILSQGIDTVVATGGGAETVNATGTVLYFGEADTDFTSSGAATLVGFQGTLSGNGSSLVFDDNATTIHVGTGTSTIIGTQGGLGGTSIDGGSGATLYFGTANLTYVGSTAVDTLVGTGGTMAATVGTAGALIFGAGGDSIVSPTGPLTFLGFGSAAVTLGGSASNLVALASGDVDASQSSGSNTFFDNGSVSIAGGSGATAIVAGSGNSTLNPGGGETLILVGDLTSTQRTLTIGDFNGARDFIGLEGFASNAGALAFQSETISSTPSGSDTTVTLLDGTRIVFENPQNLASFSFQ
jgi:hypothetical protein